MQQIEKTANKKFVEAVFGDERNYSYELRWCYDVLIAVYMESSVQASPEELVRICTETIPGRVFEMACALGWLNHIFNDDGDIDELYDGDAELWTFSVDREFRDAFLALLPIEEHIRYRTSKGVLGDKSKWKTYRDKTPFGLIDDFLSVKRRPSQLWLAKQMYRLAPRKSRLTQHAYRRWIRLRLIEPRQTQKPDPRGLRQAGLLVKIFQWQEPGLYDDLKPEDFYWRKV